MLALLELDLHWRILALSAIPVVFAVVLQWVTQHSPLAGYFQSFIGVVAPFFVSVGILFALFATFLGADIWQRVQASNHSLEHEAGAIQSLRQIASTQGPKGAGIEESLLTYIKTSIAEEWVAEGTDRSEAVDNALEKLVTAILDPALSTDDHRTAQVAMLESYRDIRRARAERFHVVESHSDPYKWIAVILLGLLTQIAIAMIHLDNSRAQGAAVTVFTIAFVVTLSVLAAHESPLADLVETSPDPIHRLAR